MSELIDYIGDEFDFSVLTDNDSIISAFCAFPDLIGEVYCDESVCATIKRGELFIRDYIDPIRPEIEKGIKKGIDQMVIIQMLSLTR